VIRTFHGARHRCERDPWLESGFVFTGHLGQSLHVNVLVTQFKRLIRKAELPELRFHDLRHTSVTLLLAQGVHPKIVQE